MRRTSYLKNIFRVRRSIPRCIYWGIGAATFIIPLVVWWLVTSNEAVDPIFLPSPAKTLDAAVALSGSGKLWMDIGVSVARVTIGFILAAAVAIPLGILMGSYHAAEAVIEPTVNFIRYMPAAAFIPLLMLYIGIGEGAKIAIIFIGTYFQLILMVAAEVRNVPMDMINVAYTLGISRHKVLTRVIIPCSLPGLIESLRITLGWAWTYVVVAELIAADQGLGFRIMESQRFLKTEVIFLYILIIGVLGLIFDQSFKLVQRKLISWVEAF